MSRWLPPALCAVVLLGLPGALEAQCADALLEEGIEAYQEVDLEAAEPSLRRALAELERGRAECSEERARALTYLGATHWFTGAPDSTLAAFRRAVIQAPSYRPDELVFPPQITDLYDRARGTTPSVFVTTPDTTTDPWTIGIGASTDHMIEVSVRPLDDGGERTLYQGAVTEEAADTRVTWDGRMSTGEGASYGRHTLRIVSLDSLSRPIRAVEVPLMVEFRPTPPGGGDRPSGSTGESTRENARSRRVEGGSLWGALGRAGVGLLGGGVVVALPWMLDDPPGSEVRYPVAGALGVAGIVGLARHLWGDDEPERPQLVYPDVEPGGDPASSGSERSTGAEGEPVQIEAGAPEREELAPGGSER